MTASSRRVDGYLDIGDYAAIGDGRAFALVGIDGAIDWMCLPQIDSPSIFAALLDPERGGRFTLRPAVPFTSSRRYIERTNVLETTFETEQGTARITDTFTIDASQTAPWRELVRRLEGLSGSVPMKWCYEPRLDYGRRAPEMARYEHVVVARDRGLQIGLLTWDVGEPELAGGSVLGEVTIAEGQRAMLVMQATVNEPLPVPARRSVERRLDETAGVWRSWVSRHSYVGPWRDAVDRSLLAIKLLADGRTGAIAAAGTTSLPEAIGAERNYDYRFGWVRDLCFTLDALLAVDMQELTQAAVTWLLKATAHTHPRVDPVYALDGSVVRNQVSLPLSGYHRTPPVLLGNNAGAQLQLGGFGDLMETLRTYVRSGHILDPNSSVRVADIADLLTHLWPTEDSGLWELGNRAHYGSSKLGVWVAFQSALELADRGQVPPRHSERWERARDQVREMIEHHLFSETKNSYLFRAGSDELDCAMLLMLRRRFGNPAGARIRGTIEAIRRELHAGGPLLYRYSGMQNQENAFLACSFWLVEALAITGRADEAGELMDDLVALANDVGLYSEEIEPLTRRLRGNLPQALTHLSLINAAVALRDVRPSTL